LTAEKHEQFLAIVLGGLHWEKGMVGFGAELSEDDAEAIRAFVIERAHYWRGVMQAERGSCRS
jgi:quinohemoprotein ethanol dehydrogenase